MRLKYPISSSWHCELRTSALKSRIVKFLPIGCASLLAFAATKASGELVHISVERRSGVEYGAGYTIGRDAECFIISPLHVVEFSTPDAITVTGADGRSANARLVKQSEDYDLALLRVSGSSQIDCPADWVSGANSPNLVSSAPFLVSRKVDASGRVAQARFFVASTSREFIELDPYGANDGLREGDSGSSLYAEGNLVGMVTSVDTRTGRVTAVMQNQIHALFGADVLPEGLKKVIIGPFTYRSVDNPFAIIAAREYAIESGKMEIVSSPAADSSVPENIDYLIKGEILSISLDRALNPDYEPPMASNDTESIGRQLFRNLREQLEEQVDTVLGQNSEARYLNTYTVVVQIQIDDLINGAQILGLEQRPVVIPDIGASSADMENAALRDAVKDILKATFEKNNL